MVAEDARPPRGRGARHPDTVDFTEDQTAREQARRILTAAHQPMTAAELAAATGITRPCVSRGLRQLEAAGDAVRQPGRRYQGGREPDRWTAARPA